MCLPAAPSRAPAGIRPAAASPWCAIFDGAPDPKVGFGRDGAYDKTSQLAPLGAKKGHQTYQLPASVDPAKYNEVYIWCEQYSVPLGVAKLQ